MPFSVGTRGGIPLGGELPPILGKGLRLSRAGGKGIKGRDASMQLNFTLMMVVA